VKRRRSRIPAAIPSASFLFGDRSGAGGGGESGNCGAGVYRVGSFLLSPRVCPPSVLMVVLRFPVAVVLLLWGISSLKACSDDDGIVGEVVVWLF
jgi:hypothetical protein